MDKIASFPYKLKNNERFQCLEREALAESEAPGRPRVPILTTVSDLLDFGHAFRPTHLMVQVHIQSRKCVPVNLHNSTG